MAAAWEFHLPLAPADLLRAGGYGRYVVQEVLPVRELPSAITAFRTAFRAQGALAVLQHFDSIYSLLHHFRAVEPAIKEDAVELMMKVVSYHCNELPTILADSGLSRADRTAHLNALKMNCYLLTGLADAFEIEICKSGLLEVHPGRKNKKTSAKNSVFLWEEEREPLLQLLLQLLQLNLRQLWGGLVVEEEFVSLMTGSCYRILENPSIGLQKHRATREAITHLLAAALSRYDHMFSATLKIMQMLQHFEHVAPVFAQAVSLWATEYGLKSLVGELLREIGQKCPQDLARDTSGVKGYAAFITELAERTPALVLSNMSVLLPHLDGESYVMRNAVLAAMAEALVQVLNGDQLEEAARGTRDQFLATLQTHICDVNSFVRSRVLQLLARIVQCRALPLTLFRSLVPLVVGRLKDKAVVVVKNAIQLLAAFLSNNPFSSTLNCADLDESLKKEMQKLQEMRERSKSTADIVVTPEEEWEAMLPELRAVTQQLFQPLQEEEEDLVEIGETVESTLQQITELLRKLNYKRAAHLTQKALSCFQGKEPFTGPTEENEEATILGVMKRLYIDSCPRGNSENPPNGNSPNSEEVVLEEQAQSELLKQQMVVQYLKDAYSFSEKITEAMDLISKRMYENSITVVQEAIEFFVTASQFEVPQALLGVRRMLPLIWSKEPGVREAVLSAYRRLYLPDGARTHRAGAQSLVQSLSLITVDASQATIDCLEEIVSEFVQKNEISPAVIQLLWGRFTQKSPCSPQERRAAVMLLGMMARGNPEIIGSNLDVLMTVGLSEKAEEDYCLAQQVCHAISKFGRNPKPAQGKDTAPFRLPQDHTLFGCLSETLSQGFAQPSSGWIPFMEAAVALIYQLAEGPEEICAHILQKCTEQALKKLQEADGQKADAGGSPSRASESGSSLPTFLLTRLVSLVGHVALQQVVHLEVAVSAELRRRRTLREEKTKKRSLGSTKKQRPQSLGSETTMEEELLVGASADDTEAELIRSICETELLEKNHLFSAYVPLVLKICNNPGLYSDALLSAAAALALGKLCMISSEFCDSHLRLLFTMMEKSTVPGVRSNLIIAAGDLAIRFPNQVEPWTAHLYARLRDPCPSVRHTAGMVMTHLILKDMVKVKGQVSEMAALLIDPEEEIMGLAQTFFSELSKKDNAIYNLLPDIISRLSDPSCGTEEKAFHTIMRHLFSYITKDKQTESLVEKLCQRFRIARQQKFISLCAEDRKALTSFYFPLPWLHPAFLHALSLEVLKARTDRQYQDLAFCLTLLPLSERGLHKLQDNFDCFADKLQDPAVYSCFQTLLGRFLRGGSKPETKTLAEELQQMMSASHNRGLDSEELCQGGSRTPMPQPAKQKPAASSRRQPLSPANSDEDFVTPQPRRLRNQRSTKKPLPRKKPLVTFSSDEENSSEDELLAELRPEETPTKTTPITRASARRQH